MSQNYSNSEIHSQIILLEKRIAVLEEKIKTLISAQPQVIMMFGFFMIGTSVVMSFAYNNEIASFTLFALGLAAGIYGYATGKDNKTAIINHEREIKMLVAQLDDLKREG